MYHRIYSLLCKYKLISTNQFGFCSNPLTEHALISLIETITSNNEIICGVLYIYKRLLTPSITPFYLRNKTIMEKEVKAIIGSVPFLLTGNNMCQ